MADAVHRIQLDGLQPAAAVQDAALEAGCGANTADLFGGQEARRADSGRVGEPAPLRLLHTSESLGFRPEASRRRQREARAMTTHAPAPAAPEAPYRGIESFR